jgi:cytochrome c oxidase subunit 2
MMRGLRNPYVQVAIWTLGIGTAFAAIVLTVPWLPEESSTAANPIDTLYDVLAVISSYIFALVVSIMLVSVIHFRRRHNDLSDGAPIHGHTTLEAVWTAIPALLMVGAAVYSGLVLADIEETKANTQEVEITGQQFAWTFKYQSEDFRAGELHLVEDTPYHFELKAVDVLHSFWVPQFRMKKDAVPGITTDVRVTPTKTGRFTLACTELCGLGHPTMRASVVVEDQASFDKWAAAAKKAENQIGGGTPESEAGGGTPE